MRACLEILFRNIGDNGTVNTDNGDFHIANRLEFNCNGIAVQALNSRSKRSCCNILHLGIFRISALSHSASRTRPLNNVIVRIIGTTNDILDSILNILGCAKEVPLIVIIAVFVIYVNFSTNDIRAHACRRISKNSILFFNRILSRYAILLWNKAEIQSSIIVNHIWPYIARSSVFIIRILRIMASRKFISSLRTSIIQFQHNVIIGHLRHLLLEFIAKRELYSLSVTRNFNAIGARITRHNSCFRIFVFRVKSNGIFLIIACTTSLVIVSATIQNANSL